MRKKYYAIWLLIDIFFNNLMIFVVFLFVVLFIVFVPFYKVI